MQSISLFISLCLVGVILAQQPSRNSPDLQRWKEMALSVPRTNAAAVGTKNYAIIAGGLTENGTASDVVDLLDVSTRNISQHTLPTARYNMLALSIGSYAIFAGGFDRNETSASPVNVVEVLDVESMQWKSTQFPDPFYNSMVTATTAGNHAVFFNGTGFAVYNPAAGSAWITKDFADTFPKIQPGSLASFESIVYVFQYDDPPRFIGYNTTSSTLIQGLSSLPSGVNVRGEAFGPGFSIDSNVYFSSLDTLYIYNTQDGLWSIALYPTAAPELPSVVPLQGYIFLHQTDQQYLFSTTSTTWDVRNFIISANASALTVVEDKYVVIAGGFDDDQVTAAVNVLEFVPPTPPVTPIQQEAPTTSATVHVVASVGLVLTTALSILI